MATSVKFKNKFLETSTASATTCWDDLLTLQVSLFFPHEMQFLNEWEPWRQAQSVLDVGCGNGAYLSKLHSFFAEKSYSGIDVSSELIDVAKERYKEMNFIAEDFFSYKQEELSDLIIMRFIIQHLNDFPAILTKAATLMNPDGGLLVIEPDFQNSRNMPETPRFKALLEAFENHTASEGLNKAQLGDMQSLISNSPGWYISEHVRLAVPNIGPFCNTNVLSMYHRWIDLIEQFGQIDFSYDLGQVYIHL